MVTESNSQGESISKGPPSAVSTGKYATARRCRAGEPGGAKEQKGPELGQLLEDPAKLGGLRDGELRQILVEISALLAMVSARIGSTVGSDQRELAEDAAENLQQLTVSKVAALLDVPKARVYELIRRGQIPALRVGAKNVRVSRVALREWIAGHQEPGEPPSTAYSRSTGRADRLRTRRKAPATARPHSSSPGGAPRGDRPFRRAQGAGQGATSQAESPTGPRF